VARGVGGGAPYSLLGLLGLLCSAHCRRHRFADVDAAQQLAGARTEVLAGQPACAAIATEAAALPDAGAAFGGYQAAAGIGGPLPGCRILAGQAPRRFGLRRLLPRQILGALAGGRLLGAFLSLALVGELMGALLLGQLLASGFFGALLLG
jgi:hypothetical protein